MRRSGGGPFLRNATQPRLPGRGQKLQAQASTICEQAASLAHSRKIFDRSSAAARIGVWQCNLADESLQWTDVVYDIFDLPRGLALDRKEIVKCYTPQFAEFQVRRSRAIEERTGFGMDAEIITAKGVRRWISITATVESEAGVPVRIFGMKQDITEEKIQADRTRYLAEFDVMTGLANRGQFQSRLPELAARPAERMPRRAVPGRSRRLQEDQRYIRSCSWRRVPEASGAAPRNGLRRVRTRRAHRRTISHPGGTASRLGRDLGAGARDHRQARRAHRSLWHAAQARRLGRHCAVRGLHAVRPAGQGRHRALCRQGGRTQHVPDFQTGRRRRPAQPSRRVSGRRHSYPRLSSTASQNSAAMSAPPNRFTSRMPVGEVTLISVM